METLEKMTAREMADAIFDKLCDNDENTQFNHSWGDDIVVGTNSSGEVFLGVLIGDTEFYMKLERHEKGDFKIFENEPLLKISAGKIERSKEKYL